MIDTKIYLSARYEFYYLIQLGGKGATECLKIFKLHKSRSRKSYHVSPTLGEQKKKNYFVSNKHVNQFTNKFQKFD